MTTIDDVYDALMGHDEMSPPNTKTVRAIEDWALNDDCDNLRKSIEEQYGPEGHFTTSCSGDLITIRIHPNLKLNSGCWSKTIEIGH